MSDGASLGGLPVISRPFRAARVRSPVHRGTTFGWVMGVGVILLLGALGMGFGNGLHPASAASTGPTPAVLAGSPPSGAVGLHHLESVPLHPTPPTQRVGLPQSSWLAYNHAYHAFFVATPPSSIDIINACTCSLGVNFTIPTGSDPFGVAVNDASGAVFVTNTGSNNVTVLQGDSAYPVANLSVGSAPTGIAYDPNNGLVYVANSGSNSVTVLDGTSPYSTLATVSVGLDPVGVGVAPSAGPGSKVFVADEAASNVTVLNGSLAADPQYVVTTVGVGDEPYGIAYDNFTQNLYVTNQGSGNVSVLSSSTLTAVASIPVEGSSGQLQGIAYDSGNRTLWAGAGNLYIAVLDPATNTLSAAVNFDPSGVTYDPDNGNVCVTNTGNATFECLSFTDPPNFPSSPTDAVTFQETGLPSGDPWSVGLLFGGPTENSTASTITFGAVPCSGFEYVIGSVGTDYDATPSSGTVVPVQNCAQTNVTVNITFAYDTSRTDSVSFNESSLPAGTAWWVSIGGESLSRTGPFPGTVNFTLPAATPNTTYTFTVLPVPGFDASPSSGTLTIYGNTVSQPIVFVPSNASYPVQFSENGLAYGTTWGVAIDGTSVMTTSAYLGLDLGNGTYNYSILPPGGYTPTLASGVVLVNGAGANVQVDFVSGATMYTVAFDEVGLPAGTAWSVNLSGAPIQSNSSGIYFNEPNGTYSFWVYEATAGSTLYAPSSNNGSVTVMGASVAVNVTFAPAGPSYPVTFNESGLASATAWSVNFGGATLRSTSAQIVGSAPNGTYTYGVGAVSGYQATPSGGLVVVNGLPITVPIAFSAVTGGGNGTYAVLLLETGLPNGTAWAASLGGTTGSSSTTTIQFSEPNGSFVLNVTPPGNYTANYSSPVVVNGASAYVSVAFTAATYPVAFLESGLPTGSAWTVTAVNPATHGVTPGQSTGNELTLRLSNGDYLLTATGPAGYHVTLASSSVVVNGASPGTITVSYASPNSGGESTPSTFAIPLVVAASVITLVLASLAAVWGFTTYRLRMRRAEGDEWVRQLRADGSESDERRMR